MILINCKEVLFTVDHEEGELQEFSVKGYRETTQYGITSFECQIIVRDESFAIQSYWENSYNSNCSPFL